MNSISINIDDNFSSSISNNDIKISSMTKKINIKKNNNRKIDDGKVNAINKIGVSNI